MGDKKFYINLLFILFIQISFSYSQDSSTYNIYSIYREPTNLDVKLFRAINNQRTNTLDRIIFITDKSILPASVLTPALIFLAARVNKNYYDDNSSVLCAISEGTSATLTFGIKMLFKRPRPYEVLKYIRRNQNDMSFTGPYSFPSGHTSTAFSLATSLTLRYPDRPWLITGLYTYATIVAIGRIYLGVHYPTDILGGIFVGSGSALLVYSLRKQIITFKNAVFRENTREDKSNNSNFTPFLLLSFVSGDLLNYLFTNSNNKILNKMNVNLSNQDFYKINLSYQF
jgi:membrane-associated phospholipid phosphatase